MSCMQMYSTIINPYEAFLLMYSTACEVASNCEVIIFIINNYIK